MNTVLSIAGSDSSGGAGIQADLKTLTVLGVYGMTAVTALTAQNTTGVTAVSEVTPEFLEQQLDAVFTDIPPDAVKIGMVSSPELIRTIAKKLEQYRPKQVVVDPVMVATSGARLITKEGEKELQTTLLPLATVITPNIPEAELLCGQLLQSRNEREQAAITLSKQYGCAVLIKGGHSTTDADDVLCHDGKLTWFTAKRVDNPNTHGTGCTLSSAIAAYLAKGESLPDAVAHAKEYLYGALQSMLNLGHGSGPIDHGYMIRKGIVL